MARAPMKEKHLVVALALGLVSAFPPMVAQAQSSWLDQQAPASWNTPGMAVPTAPAMAANDDPRCQETQRPAETAEDAAVEGAGWKLFREYQAGWGVRLVWGLVSYDGMCRPFGYQAFVFVDGAFAGTVSPEPMASRADGSVGDVNVLRPNAPPPASAFSATFNRYSDTDPLCCPSRRTFVEYRIERGGNSPVLVPTSASTSDAGPN
jgi:hypothetical protein